MQLKKSHLRLDRRRHRRRRRRRATSHFDARALAARRRPPQPAAASRAPAVAPTAAANLPDFTALVDRAGAVRRQHQRVSSGKTRRQAADGR